MFQPKQPGVAPAAKQVKPVQPVKRFSASDQMAKAHALRQRRPKTAPTAPPDSDADGM